MFDFETQWLAAVSEEESWSQYYIEQQFQDLSTQPDKDDRGCPILYSFAEGLMASIHSPFSRFLKSRLKTSKPRVNIICRDALKYFKSRYSSTTPAVKSSRKPLVCGPNTIIAEAINASQALQIQAYQKRKTAKLVINNWLQRKPSMSKEGLRLSRANAKLINQGIKRFWKVAATIGAKRLQHELRFKISELRAQRQVEWVARAEIYAQRLSARLELDDEEFSNPEEEWDRQERQDVRYDEIMSCSSSSESEVEKLHQELNMDIQEILSRYQEEGVKLQQQTQNRLRKRRRFLAAVNPIEEQPMVTPIEEQHMVTPIEEQHMVTPIEEQPMDIEEEVNGVQHRRKQRKEESPKTKIEPGGSNYPTRLLSADLRPYQLDGLRWLVRLHDCGINGILADEMGLGKTVQSIAYLAYLAEVRGIWGPHLIVVPMSVALNWENEFRKFAPGLKVITYIGSKKERARKRLGWKKLWAFNVCITTYNIALVDSAVLRRMPWYCMVMDEAQHLKNANTTRWQTLIQFNAERRLLLTGTPLQNNLQELWALMYFIMPEVFGSHSQWNELFSDPLSNAIEKSQLQHEVLMIQHLYKILRPFFCRRLKRDVESQMPMKVEHVIQCRLSKRQRNLYDEILYSSTESGVFEQGQYMAIMNTLMHLRKVCNHPDLIEDRHVLTSLSDARLYVHRNIPDLVICSQEALLIPRIKNAIGRQTQEIHIRPQEIHIRSQEIHIRSQDSALGVLLSSIPLKPFSSVYEHRDPETKPTIFYAARKRLEGRARNCDQPIRELLLIDPWIQRRKQTHFDPLRNIVINSPSPMYDSRLVEFLTKEFAQQQQFLEPRTSAWEIRKLIQSRFHCLLPFNVRPIGPLIRYAAHRQSVTFIASLSGPGAEIKRREQDETFSTARKHLYDSISDDEFSWWLNSNMIMPHPFDLEHDSGKLLVLTLILQRAYNKRLKCIIFTQMAKVLDILEQYINLRLGYKYVRLDGSTKAEKRQMVITQFNTDETISIFLASTRAGGLGINLTAASIVVFFDTDWNPAMDRQAMDRCHRLGQTRDVHIYRLICGQTIEENIWRKQLQKRKLDEIVVDQGKFSETYTFEDKVDARDLLFTIDSSADLYVSRILHDKPENTAGLPTEPPTRFEELLCQVEDLEDRQALKQTASDTANMAVEEMFQDFQSQEDSSGRIYVDRTHGYVEVSPLVSYAVQFLETVARTKAMEDLVIKANGSIV